MKKKTIALFMTAAMTAALCGCGSQPETTAAEENQTQKSESLEDEDTAEDISAADEESADDAEDENTDGESEDLSEDSEDHDSDDVEESDEAEESDESDDDTSTFFDLGFMSFELPANWEIDEYESFPEDEEYYLAPYGDIYITGMDISIMHESVEDEPEMVSMVFESEDAVLEEYMNSELGDGDYPLSISIKKLSQTFIGKTREISIEMTDPEDENSVATIIFYLGLDHDDVYGIALQILDDTSEEDTNIQDGINAIDMLFATGKLLK